MQPVLTPEEMADADRHTIAAGTPVEVLMERAGRAVAWAVRRVCGGTYGQRVVVVCGKGNNGGDGLIAARVLRGWGAHVDVFQLKDGIDRDRCRRAIELATCAIDAMFGTGFRGELPEDAEWVAGQLYRAGAPVVAVDIPSGIDGLTGEMRGVAVHAAATVTFAALKPGLLVPPGDHAAGQVEVADIGIDIVEPAISVTDRDDLGALGSRGPYAHKWESGLMVVGGSGGMTGAPLMVSHAAMRAGAGIVWCCIPRDADAGAAAASGTEVITKDLAEVTDALEHVERFKAVVVGPGLGRDERVAAGVRELVAKAPVPLVLDADGLNALAGDLAPIKGRSDATVLTPHEGEYKRIAGAEVGGDRLAAARSLAARAGAVVLLKGPATVVAQPDGRAAINPTGGPWLATAGTGDVLSGIIGGLLAGGEEPFLAASAGAWLHGRAADVAGHTGLVAGDLIEALPATLRSLEED